MWKICLHCMNIWKIAAADQSKENTGFYVWKTGREMGSHVWHMSRETGDRK